MSHPEQQAFFGLAAAANVDALAKSRLLEIGAYDVNGSVRDVLLAREHIGCDLTAGPGVDVVGYGHELNYPDGSFDVTISGECFEHDPHWRQTFSNMVRMTRPGGLVLFTCASRGRLEHGTTRTEPTDSPGTQARGWDYYRNLTKADFRGMPRSWFSEHRFWRNDRSCDLYFAGLRSGRKSEFVLPTTEEVSRINAPRREPEPRGERLLQAPLRPLSFLPDPAFQSLAFAYLPRARRLRAAVRRAVPDRRASEHHNHPSVRND